MVCVCDENIDKEKVNKNHAVAIPNPTKLLLVNGHCGQLVCEPRFLTID